MMWALRDVSVYFGPRAALQGVNLEVKSGSIVAVVGGDGAGKSTLLGLLAGTVGTSSGHLERPPLARLGYLPTSSGVYLDLSVAENLAFVARAHRLARARTLERTHVLLERAGLAGFENRLGGELSGGMRQKLGLIRVLLPEPDLLVLDEPTTGIDPVSRRALWAIVARAAADGAAVVVSTSYLDEAERAAHILVLDRGRPLAEGTREDILRRTPGILTAANAPPVGETGVRFWRRGTRWRIWGPHGVAAADGAGELVVPDLQDAVTIAALQHEAEEVSL